MAPLGMLVLGAFVGALVTGFFFKTPPGADTGKILTGFIGVALGAAIMGFIQFMSKLSGSPIGPSIYYYPIGLGYGMLLMYLKAANDNISSTEKRLQILGYSHVFGVLLASVMLLAIFLSSDFRSLIELADPN